jgi:3-methyl-2-oxobutanoate hydroxymethyltransferase
LGQSVTQASGIPTIGIGAGAHTSGQVLVFHDLLHLNSHRKAKFVPERYLHVGQAITSVLGEFSADVRAGTYPSDRESYH